MRWPFAKVEHGKLLKQGLRLAKTSGRRSELVSASWESIGDYGQYLTSQKISRISLVGVAFIFDPGQAPCLRVGPQIAARQGQQRSQQAPVSFLHGCGAPQSGPAQQIVQKGFGLIVGMMRQQYPFSGMIRQGFMPQSSSRRFKSERKRIRYLDPNHVKRHTEALAKPCARHFPGVGTLAQAMMNMPGRKVVATVPGQEMYGMQQHRGIQPARIADNQRTAVLDVPGKGCSYSPQDGLSGWIVP